MRYLQIEQQLAYEFNLSLEDLKSPQAHFVHKVANRRHRYWGRFSGDIIIYRSKLLCRMENAQALKEIRWSFPGFIDGDGQWFYEKDNLPILVDILKKYGLTIIHRAPFFAAPPKLEAPQLDWERVIYGPDEILDFKYDPRVEHAFSFGLGAERDQLGLGYYEDGQLLAMAGASWVAPDIWEMGIDKLVQGPEYAGLATDLVKDFTNLIQEQEPGICLTYSTQYSHLASMNVAIRAGYEIAWSELVIGPPQLFDA